MTPPASLRPIPDGLDYEIDPELWLLQFRPKTPLFQKPSAVNGWIHIHLDRYKNEYKYKQGEVLWELFQEDFEDWNSALFGLAHPHLRRDLYDHLFTHGVNLAQATKDYECSYAKRLAAVVRETEPTPYTPEDRLRQQKRLEGLGYEVATKETKSRREQKRRDPPLENPPLPPLPRSTTNSDSDYSDDDAYIQSDEEAEGFENVKDSMVANRQNTARTTRVPTKKSDDSSGGDIRKTPFTKGKTSYKFKNGHKIDVKDKDDPPDDPSDDEQGGAKPFKKHSTIDSAQLILNLSKMYYKDELKYGGVLWDILNVKLKKFYSLCDSCNLPESLYAKAFPHMLKGAADAYYCNTMVRKESKDMDFSDMVCLMKAHFEITENRKLYLTVWRTTTYNGVIASPRRKRRKRRRRRRV